MTRPATATNLALIHAGGAAASVAANQAATPA